MEERLDDAINVLRNHAESQLNLSQIPANLLPPNAQMSSLNFSNSTRSDVSYPETLKQERIPHSTSK